MSNSSETSSTKHDNSQNDIPVEEEDDTPKMDNQFFKKLLRSDIRQYYSTPELNEILYLHFKGFRKIENLEQFPLLKVVYLESNGILKIEGLSTLTHLSALYLHENAISKIEGLESLVNLHNLNLSENLLTKIDGLSSCVNLDSLNVAKNRIGQAGPADIAEIIALPKLTCVDLSENIIEDPNVFPEVFEKMKDLRVLYLQGNAVTKKIQNYRKILVTKLHNLKYLDDKPVFDEDRRYAEAFCKGGIQKEREERAKVKAENEEADRINRELFEKMLSDARLAREEEKKLQNKMTLAQKTMSENDINALKNEDSCISQTEKIDNKETNTRKLNKEEVKEDKVNELD
jgi:dynein assembly factor 1